MKLTDEQIERTQVEQVFGLMGGELENSAWKVGEKTISRYWYEGAPEYAARDFRNYDTVRVAVHCGSSAERIEVEGGAWVRKNEFRSSGETECCHRSGAPEDEKVKRKQCRLVADPYRHTDTPHGAPGSGRYGKEGAKRAECPFCEARLGEDHGYIYLGDGWVETVYAWEDALRCRYPDCAHPVATEDEQVTCPDCRKDLGLPERAPAEPPAPVEPRSSRGTSSSVVVKGEAVLHRVLRTLIGANVGFASEPAPGGARVTVPGDKEQVLLKAIAEAEAPESASGVCRLNPKPNGGKCPLCGAPSYSYAVTGPTGQPVYIDACEAHRPMSAQKVPGGRP